MATEVRTNIPVVSFFFELLLTLSKQESTTLNLSSYDDVGVVLMMEYLYTGAYATQSHPPDFSLPIHIKVFVLASLLQIPGLQALSCHYFNSNLSRHVTDLEVYFAAIKQVYEQTTYTNPELRAVMVATAASEMRNIQGSEAVKKRFYEITSLLPEFHVCSFFLVLDCWARC